MKTRPTFAILSAVLLLASAVPAAPAEIEIITHKTEEEGLPANAVTALTPDGASGVFVASDAGLFGFFDYFFVPVFQRVRATLVTRDPEGDVWAATDSGLIWRVSLSDDIWSAVRYPFVPREKITAIAARHDALFVGTDKGLYCFSTDDETFRRVMARRAVSALSVLSDGTLIAAVRERLPARTGLLIIGGEFCSRAGWVAELSGSAIGALCADADRLLIGTEKGAVLILDKTGIREIPLSEKAGRIHAIAVCEGLLVIGSERGLLAGEMDGPVTPLSTANGTEIRPVTSLAPGPDRGLWVGTNGGGLYLVRIHP